MSVPFFKGIHKLLEIYFVMNALTTQILKYPKVLYPSARVRNQMISTIVLIILFVIQITVEILPIFQTVTFVLG